MNSCCNLLNITKTEPALFQAGELKIYREIRTMPRSSCPGRTGYFNRSEASAYGQGKSGKHFFDQSLKTNIISLQITNTNNISYIFVAT